MATGNKSQIQQNQPDIHGLFVALTNQVATAFVAIQRVLPVLSENNEIMGGEWQNLEEIGSLQTVACEVELSCYRSSKRAQNKSLVPHDRPLLTTSFEPGNIDVISENDSKAITAFSNGGSDSKLLCENFQRDVMTLAQSKSITEQACKQLLHRKLSWHILTKLLCWATYESGLDIK